MDALQKKWCALFLGCLIHANLQAQISVPGSFELKQPLSESVFLVDTPPELFSWSASEGANSYDILAVKQGHTEVETWAEGLKVDTNSKVLTLQKGCFFKNSN